MKDSLKQLKNLFPWFLDKSDSSNFSKSQWVTNRRFQRLDNDLFKIYQNFKLNKNLLIWKDQDEPYDYTINFVANFKNLKTVTCYKNDDVIYTESFEYSDFVDTFEYSYTSSTLDEVEDESLADIIPQHQFKIEIETYDEYSLIKGWPENDTYQGNEFDHDLSLDKLGDPNIPRKKYLIVGPELYSSTEPPYNDRATEDDYHYMKRMLEYNLRLHDTPAPVLEIWKLYGITATMENRERLLLKMFDIYKHGHMTDDRVDENGNYIAKGDRLYVDRWEPELWEHKDGFCEKLDDFGQIFFVNANNVNPKKFSDVIFTFNFLNIYGQNVDIEYAVDIYLDGDILEPDYHFSTFKINTENLDELNVNLFKFFAKNNEGEIIGEQEIEINVKGCNDADFYVRADGDDRNPGSKDEPFATIGKAISCINTYENMIVISGDVNLDYLHVIPCDCTILGCNNGTIKSILPHNKFFNVARGIEVTLSDLSLFKDYAVHYSKVDTFVNKNNDYNNFETILLHGGLPVLSLTANQDNYYHIYDNVILDFTAFSMAGNPIIGMELDLYIDDEYYTTLITDEDGSGSIILNNQSGTPFDVNYKLLFNETSVFYENTIEELVHLTKNTPRIDRKYGPLLELETSSEESLDLYENGELLHEAVFEDDAVSVTYSPEYGEHIVYFSDDGIHVFKEWIVNSRFYISDLDVPYLVTDVEVNNDGELYATFTPLSDFMKVSDLENVIVNLELEDGKLYKEYFQLTNIDSGDGNEICPVDLVNLQQAIVDVVMDDGKLEIERIDTIILEEE